MEGPRRVLTLAHRHKRRAEDGLYSGLSWHVTLLAVAPYREWRSAMQYMEQHVYPKYREDSMRMSLLSDLHITKNSKASPRSSLPPIPLVA